MPDSPAGRDAVKPSPSDTFPIQELPNELLSVIVFYTLPVLENHYSSFQSFREYIKTLYHLRGVCWIWQAIVDGTPSLWNVLTSTVPDEVNLRTISRSGSCSLVLHANFFKLHPHRPYAEGTTPTMFYQLVAPYLHRCMSIMWHVPVASTLSSLASHLPPVLNQMNMALPCDTFFDPSIMQLTSPVTVDGGVKLFRVNLPWNSVQFKRLQYLVLWDVGDNGLTASHLLDFLQSSPGLKSLDLNCVHVQAAPTAAHYPLVHLPHLHLMRVLHPAGSGTASVLSRLQVPNCSNFHVDLTADPANNQDPDLLNTVTALLRDFIKPISGEIEESTVSFGPGEQVSWRCIGGSSQSIGTPTSRKNLEVRVDDIRFDLALDWMKELLQAGAEPPKGIQATIVGSRFFSNACRNAFGSWPSVSQIELNCRKFHTATSFLDFISDRESGTILPALRSVCISGRQWSGKEVAKIALARSKERGEGLMRGGLEISLPRDAAIKDAEKLVAVRHGIKSVRVRWYIDPFDVAVPEENPVGMLAIVWEDARERLVFG